MMAEMVAGEKKSESDSDDGDAAEEPSGTDGKSPRFGGSRR